jgi:hypothetical protein
MKYSKKEQEIIDNYLNSGRHDQTLKNAQMLASIYTILQENKKLKEEIKKLKEKVVFLDSE